MINIQIRQVDPSYLRFLRSFDDHVPSKATRPWLWPVMLNGIEYGIPCTTQDTASGYAGYLRCGSFPDRGINLRYMIPVPPNALIPAQPMSPELRLELRYYEENRKYIEAEAQLIYQLVSKGQMDHFFRSCDYQKLNSVYLQWQPGKEAGLFYAKKEEAQNMPISKKGNLYYTKEQYEAARYNSNALEYAQRQGYDLVNQSGWYKLREHDSMVFTPDGRWYWNSRGLNGGALEFMMYYEGKTITEAVLTLANDPEYVPGRPAVRSNSPRQTPLIPRPADQAIPKASFRLPEKAANFRYLFGYLCGTRGLEKSVVQEMINQNRLYQSRAKLPGGKEVFNATFVYLDEKLNPVGAYQRGMMDPLGKSAYKRDVPGSDKRFGWILEAPINSAVEVRVFEAAIDAASDASLDALQAPEAWREAPVDRLSLEGVSFQPLQNYLQRHPDVQQVTLMLDADEPGRRAASEIAHRLQDMGYMGEIMINHPPFGKDWNNVLTETRAMQQEALEAKAAPPAHPSQLSDEEKTLQQFADENERVFWEMNDFLDRGGNIAELADMDPRDPLELSPEL